MKLTNVTTLLFTAAVGALPLTAQQPDPSTPHLNVIVQPKASKTARIAQIYVVPSANAAKGSFAYITKEQPDQPVESNTKDFKVFFITTPPELANATRAFDEGNLAEARRQLETVRNKYGVFSGLPDNPAVRAARMELECCVRLMDWNAVRRLTESSPNLKMLEPEDRVGIEAARMLSEVSDDPATAEARNKKIEAFLADSNKVKYISTTEYGWLKYAQGRALASLIPADQIKNGISADNEVKASLAVDALCEAAMAGHGRDVELPVDAMVRAFHLLWSMPGVKAYAGSVKKMDKAAWDGGPSNFRDAVALAFMIRNIFAPNAKDEAIVKAASLYFNAREEAKS